MSVLDTATLIFAPSAYKSAAWACQKPINSGVPESLTFARASTATRVDSSGLIASVASGVPRLDYTGGGCGSCLLEPARTNLLTYSEDFSNAAWAKTQTGTGVAPVVTANAGTAPNGTTTADRIVFDASAASGDRSILRQSISALTTTGKNTVYLKSYDGSTYHISGHTGSTIGDFEVGNEWVRIEFESGTTGAVLIGLEVRNGVTGSSMADLLVWGFQTEDVNTYVTSYNPTTTATVTRALESITEDVSSATSSTSEGTVLLVVKAQQDGNGGGSTAPYFLVQYDANNYVGFVVSSTTWRGRLQTTSGGAFLNSTTIDNTEDLKMAISFSSSGWSMYANGSEFASGNDDMSEIQQLVDVVSSISEQKGYQNINLLALWTSKLTDAQMAEITT